MRSIRARLMATLMAGLAVVLALGFAAVYWIARSSLTRQLDAALEARARTISSLVVLEPGRLLFSSEDGPAQVLSQTYFELHTMAGEFLKRSENLAGYQLPMPKSITEQPTYRDIDLPGEVQGRAVWIAFKPRVDWDEYESLELGLDGVDEEDGEEAMATGGPMEPETLVVVAVMERGRVDRALTAILGALVAVGCVVSATAGLLVAFGVRWGLVPLDRLSRGLRDVEASTISRRFDGAGAPRELEPIYRELNRMLDRVQRTIERERLFASAAAHELRTPLAELRASAEVAVRWPDSDRAVAALNEALAIGSEMERLVGSLLLLSQANGAAIESRCEAVQIGVIVRRCLDSLAGLIEEKRLEVAVNVDESGTVRAPRDAVEIIVRNLIDNAVQYTPIGGEIAVSGGGADGLPLLIVRNGPVELTGDDLPHLFEPFWRSQNSRTDRDHAGLGLAVIHQIARVIGLRIEAELADDRLSMQVLVAS